MVEIPLIWILLRMHHEQIISKMSLNAKCSDQYSRFRVTGVTSKGPAQCRSGDTGAVASISSVRAVWTERSIHCNSRW